MFGRVLLLVFRLALILLIPDHRAIGHFSFPFFAFRSFNFFFLLRGLFHRRQSSLRFFRCTQYSLGQLVVAVMSLAIICIISLSLSV